jgi:hypothetical protein
MELGPGTPLPDMSFEQTQRRLERSSTSTPNVERLSKPPGLIQKAHEEWRGIQPDLNPERLVFIDETGAKTNMVRLYGRAPRGPRLKASAPHGLWMKATFVGALRHGVITAPCVFDGPMNGACF